MGTEQGDFFVESPINYLTATIWYLKEVEGGKYCHITTRDRVDQQ
jgi:hypothetical protein